MIQEPENVAHTFYDGNVKYTLYKNGTWVYENVKQLGDIVHKVISAEPAEPYFNNWKRKITYKTGTLQEMFVDKKEDLPVETKTIVFRTKRQADEIYIGYFWLDESLFKLC